jgi:hypothetical protein
MPKRAQVGQEIPIRKNCNLLKGKDLAPRARFELATLRLTAECSTVELPGIRATYLFSF